MEIKAQQMLVLLTSMFIFTLGFGIVVPILGYFVKGMGATALDLGLLLALLSAMELIFAPFWGRVSDRVGRKLVMMIGLAGFGLCFIVLGFSTQLWMLYVAEFFGGMLTAGIWPASLAYIADITGQKERGRLIGMMGAASGLGYIMGPTISSVFSIWGLAAPFFGSAALAFMTLVLMLLWLPESRVPVAHAPACKRMLASAALSSSLGTLFFFTLFISFAIACIDSTMAYFIMDRFGLTSQPSSIPVLSGSMTLTGPQVMGIVFTALGIIGALCQAVLVGKAMQRFGEEKTIVIGLVFLAIGMALLQLSSGLVSLIVFTGLMMVGASLVNPSINTLASKRTDADHQGAVMGMLGSFNSLGRVLGPLAGGFAYLISMSLPYLSSALIALLSAAALSFQTKKTLQHEN
jgi:DHA1 family multidrug resistance protein-like MFS transporter